MFYLQILAVDYIEQWNSVSVFHKQIACLEKVKLLNCQVELKTAENYFLNGTFSI